MQQPGSIRDSLFLVALLISSFAGCLSSADNEVVVYAALDKEFSEPILNQVADEFDVVIRAKFDVESNKTVGLVTDLIQHRKRPRADIFWNNEILHTIRLQQMGLLEAFVPANAKSIPADYRSADGLWVGFAARARVFIVNTDLLPEDSERPGSFFDLADPKWAGRCAMAMPLFGTSATHAAVMCDRLGIEPAAQWYRKIESNAVIEGGNRQVAIKVGRGELAFGLTDTDDAMLQIDEGNPVAIVWPDQADGDSGALLIPNTICLIRGGPHPQQAKRVLNRLLAPDIESKLAMGASAQIPLHPAANQRSRVSLPDAFKPMSVDFESAAANWDEVSNVLRAIFH